MARRTANRRRTRRDPDAHMAVKRIHRRNHRKDRALAAGKAMQCPWCRCFNEAADYIECAICGMLDPRAKVEGPTSVAIPLELADGTEIEIELHLGMADRPAGTRIEEASKVIATALETAANQLRQNPLHQGGLDRLAFIAKIREARTIGQLHIAKENAALERAAPAPVAAEEPVQGEPEDFTRLTDEDVLKEPTFETDHEDDIEHGAEGGD